MNLLLSANLKLRCLQNPYAVLYTSFYIKLVRHVEQPEVSDPEYRFPNKEGPVPLCFYAYQM
jgi:hypothetical protein